MICLYIMGFSQYIVCIITDINSADHIIIQPQIFKKSKNALPLQTTDPSQKLQPHLPLIKLNLFPNLKSFPPVRHSILIVHLC